MGGLSLLGQLAGGYAQAAERDRQRQFESDMQQRQNALGMVKTLMESPNTPPEYQASLIQHWMDIVHTPYGKKLPSTDKMMASLPGRMSPAKTSNVPIPATTIGAPTPPPMPGSPNPAAMGTGALAQGAPSLTQSATAANGGTPSYQQPIPMPAPPPAIGARGAAAPQAIPQTPGQSMPEVAPPPIPAGAQGPVVTLPGRQSSVTLAPQQISAPGQWSSLTPQQRMEMETQMTLNRAAEISQQTGVPMERVLGFQSKYMPIGWGGGALNTQTGEIETAATPKPTGKVETLPDASGQWHQFQILQDGTYKMIPTPEGVTIPPPANWAETLRSGVYHWVDADGNVHETPYQTKTQKVVPKGAAGAAGAGPAPPPVPGGNTAVPATQPKAAGAGVGVAAQPKPATATPAAGGRAAGRIISGNTPKLSPNLARTDKSYKDISAQLDKVQSPVDQLAMRLGRLEDTLAQNTPQADALVAPELLSVMAGGQGSGIRMNEAEIARIVGGRSKWESLKTSINKWKTDPAAARSITPDQQKQIQDLVTTVRTKIDQKRTLFEQARTDLQNAKSPEEHRAILTRVRNDVLAVDTGTRTQTQGGGGAGGGHMIEINGKRYTYNGSGATDDMKNYTEVKQ